MDNTEQSVTLEPNAVMAGDAVEAQDNVIKKDQTDTVTVSDTSEDIEKLTKSLEAARREAREAKAQLVNKTRTTEERVADLEKQNQDLRIERLANATIDKLIADLGDGYTVSRAEVMEELADAKLSEANMEAVISRWVNKLKRPNTVKTPENTAEPIAPSEKPEPTAKDPWVGF